ncbi:putative transferase [Rosa chinensis]|uniref:Putative transferase n=1 Tax=Rosa chinensis TaxID=74649 RepID=A0A2P6R1Q2_ROSCH|nr:adenylate isopentenyltransferase [Rosa chinensis]PRQ40346.1 putative transferase [Rosa chinensis]
MTLDTFSTHQYYNITTFKHFLSSPPVNLTPPPSLPHKPRWARMDSGPASSPQQHHHKLRKDKLIVIMGATGAGKSRLSIDLATHFPCCFEIINSDKMQVYKGLDITTNKIPVPDRLGVPHHLLGELDPLNGELSPAEFRQLAGRAVSSITCRGKVPMLVGGSNSLIHALLVDRFEPGVNNVLENGAELVSSELRYDCCFLWVDVSLVVLADYLSKRVDEMLESGMFEELAEFCKTEEEDDSAVRTGLRKAIGVPEFSQFFKKYPPGRSQCQSAGPHDPLRRGAAYNDAVRAIKDNTRQLAKKQIGKIFRLKGAGGWELRRLDATEAFRVVVTSDNDDVGRRWSEIWEEQVVEQSVKIVKRFLEQE